jgi:hypothetical protein
MNAEQMAEAMRDLGYPASRNPDEFLSEYGKKWGARVGETEIQTMQDGSGWSRQDEIPGGARIRVHSIDITPQMKRSVMTEGQPLFKKLTPVDDFMRSRRGEAGYLKLPSINEMKRGAVDILNAPRSLMSSFDLSAPLRQGAIFTLTEPRLAARATRAMFSAFVSQKKYDNIVQSLNSHPDSLLADASGLYLAALQKQQTEAEVKAAKARVAQGGNVPTSVVKLAAREEAFMSRLAGRIPWVKVSERAYVAYLDVIRMQAFSKYVREMHSRGMNPDKYDEAFKDIAQFINAATGRGNLGETLNNMAPVLNAMFFSPRYLASRVELMNPNTYLKMNPHARRIAMRKMLQFAGLVGLTLLLAKLGGAEVEWSNPDSPDWLKIKLGNTRYDFLAGFQQPMRFVYRMSKAMANTFMGQKNDRNKNASDIATNFFRSKLSPVASYVYDWMSGSTFDREKFSPAKGVMERAAPMVGRDFYEAWKEEGGSTITETIGSAAGGPPSEIRTGFKGPIKTTPAIFGVGVQTYAERKPVRRANR